MAEGGEAVVAAAFVVGEAGFGDEARGEEAVDGAVEGAGAHGDVLAGFEHDGVAVLFSVGEGEEDGEDGWGEGEMVFEVRWRCSWRRLIYPRRIYRQVE